MKKLSALLIVLALLIALGISSAFASGSVQEKLVLYNEGEVCDPETQECQPLGLAESQKKYINPECEFIDEDNDGLCDNRFMHSQVQQLCPMQNDNCQYADADGNGVCDNWEQMNCMGNGHHGYGHGRCRN